MNDKDGNMNEIITIDGIYENSNFIYKTIEEAIVFQKNNPNKIISYFEPLSNEEKIIISLLFCNKSFTKCNIFLAQTCEL